LCLEIRVKLNKRLTKESKIQMLSKSSAESLLITNNGIICQMVRKTKGLSLCKQLCSVIKKKQEYVIEEITSALEFMTCS